MLFSGFLFQNKDLSSAPGPSSCCPFPPLSSLSTDQPLAFLQWRLCTSSHCRECSFFFFFGACTHHKHACIHTKYAHMHQTLRVTRAHIRDAHNTAHSKHIHTHTPDTCMCTHIAHHTDQTRTPAHITHKFAHTKSTPPTHGSPC